VRDDAAGSVGDISKRPGMHHRGRAFRGLHQVGQNGLIEQRHHGPGRSQIAGGHRFAGLRHAHHDGIQPLAQIAEAAVKKGNRGATTDAAVAILLAEAAIRGASLNCTINLASIRDEAFRTRTEERVTKLLERADKVGHEAMAVVTDRL